MKQESDLRKIGESLRAFLVACGLATIVIVASAAVLMLNPAAVAPKANTFVSLSSFWGSTDINTWMGWQDQPTACDTVLSERDEAPSLSMVHDAAARIPAGCAVMGIVLFPDQCVVLTQRIDAHPLQDPRMYLSITSIPVTYLDMGEVSDGTIQKALDYLERRP